ncbi:2-amino-4-hydroxy-6-hydroxymethyldihydropteridine diphosphokinase [Methylococcus capsulatus]|uniref:2-amino-4-hydroxy-6- hydroxymethyldihydropteridine diphosphokinase n=1 Tax=Methylococcus capsulatus TaxID=414 RepID=UPI0002D7DECA|nr:2-amino-4-hydroxy-6-hydroxymethyldihydropteridine diphosphokinase [Methylococcus capsulatus]QXP87105.1 2-amino-4-hydroxy-6-hydroxymethyldihydropteridine diphosphokinase [Methylococcus capsulatus]QXP93215.1 2-amino-4-hydroxy-6-hydroxymethyldihydropteridine diphosphokinase [Methylococcus capsulatus]UQN12091.1 2-amino-4-hydroxy-6-hydroxymethyldihydropteridine diphosphokinase [Methylococcus capsulatus]
MSGESKAYIGLGGNLGNAAETVRTARRAIGAVPGVRELAFSSLYRSAPMGPSGQPDYVNAVMAVATSLAPQALLHALQRIERIHGRVRTGERWGPRTLDLDLLLYDDLVLDTETLRLPHPGIAEREFVLYPLAEIAPDLDIPDRGPLRELVRNCPLRGLSVIAHD